MPSKQTKTKKTMNKKRTRKSYVDYGGVKLPVINAKDKLVPKISISISLPTEDKKAIGIAVKENLACLLIGETGTGKTSAVKEIAHLLKQPYVRVNMTGFTTPDELVGSKSVKDGETYFEYGIITDAMRRGAILVIDEINATTPDCLFILHGLLDEDRRITLPNGEVIHPHKDFRVFATCNPDYEGTRSMNKAFMDRFPVVIFVNNLGVDEEISLIKTRTGIDEDLARKLVTIATMNRKNYLDSKTSIFTSTRGLLHVAKLIQHGLSPEAAYMSSVVRKTSIMEEQAVLKDSFYAVFKISGKKSEVGIPTIIDSKVLDDIKAKVERFNDLEIELQRERTQRQVEKNAFEAKLDMIQKATTGVPTGTVSGTYVTSTKATYEELTQAGAMSNAYDVAKASIEAGYANAMGQAVPGGLLSALQAANPASTLSTGKKKKKIPNF